MFSCHLPERRTSNHLAVTMAVAAGNPQLDAGAWNVRIPLGVGGPDVEPKFPVTPLFVHLLITGDDSASG